MFTDGFFTRIQVPVASRASSSVFITSSHNGQSGLNLTSLSLGGSPPNTSSITEDKAYLQSSARAVLSTPHGRVGLPSNPGAVPLPALIRWTYADGFLVHTLLFSSGNLSRPLSGSAVGGAVCGVACGVMSLLNDVTIVGLRVDCLTSTHSPLTKCSLR